MDSRAALLSAVSETIRREAEHGPPQGYNIFHVLKVSAKEVVMCRFLADLLHPEGAHGCGILFLKSFFQQVLKRDGGSDTLLAHTDVATEFVTGDGRRIDLVIQNARCVLPIEVKLYAGEQEGQCYDYYEWAKQFDPETQIIYLTRFGAPPTRYSRQEKGGVRVLPAEKILCVSWEREICGWLTALLDQLSQPVRCLVAQYIDAIAQVADGREARRMEQSMALLHQSADYFQAGIAIERAIKPAKLRLIRLVFDEFKEQMAELAEKYGLVLEDAANYYVYEEKQHERFYDCYSTYPGLNYVVKNVKFKKSGLQMWFRIEIEHNLFAGLCLFDAEEGVQVDDITAQLINEAAEYLDRDVITPDGWWLTWCYPDGRRQLGDGQDIPDFKEMNPCAAGLVEECRRKAYVKRAAAVFERHILSRLLSH